ncbi:hypothetical protein B0T24DRAFT_692387 [Lasiosphaeria ovina]|uniref:Uncharacterized protein n=1 Tax=Lasiosphaeria ovina TaxID=92902 RepID=A0AAE0JTP3_9PEZI|nr:hypothetical protein B0T24DRAFT_692387 [Lasiosphaeria ovina]
MEHLKTGSSSPPFRIPYVAAEEYEAADVPVDALQYLKAYWLRQGWVSPAKMGELSFASRSPVEAANALQTCLLRMLDRRICPGGNSRSGARLSPERGRQPWDLRVVVHSTALQALISRWMAAAEPDWGPRGVNNPKTIRHFLGQFCDMTAGVPRPHRRQMELIQLSVMALGESLGSSLSAIFGYKEHDLPTDTPFHPASLQRSSISADYYFGDTPCPRSRSSHETCHESICNEFMKVVDPENYTPAHTSLSCSCDGRDAVAIPDVVLDIVKREGILLVLWNGKTLELFEARPGSISSSRRGNSSPPYVAFSHVWADGLGNDGKENALPICQLSRLQAMVNDLYAETHLSPDGEYSSSAAPASQCPHRQRSYPRSLAIRQMALVYRQADRVLVLDSFVRVLPRTSGIVEKYMRIHLSAWHHRLWTLQEG